MTIVKFPFESAEFPEEGQITTEEVEEFAKLLEIPSKTYSFVSRREWRAAKTKLGRIKRPVNNIVVHYRWGEDKCYDPESCKEFLQDEQRRQIRECGEDDIPFHFLIGDDGTIYEGRGWNYVSSKNLELPVRFQYGYDRFDFAYIGNYEEDNRIELVKPVTTLVQHGVVMKYVAKHWALFEEPFPPEYHLEWPEKRKGPKLPKVSVNQLWFW